MMQNHNLTYAEPDNGYKPTAIPKLLKDINQRIKKAENNDAE